MELGLPMIELHDVHVDYMVQRHGFSSIKSYLTSFGTKRLLERKRILHGVDLRIDSGECFGIVGRNGSGKSTLLRLLAGIVEPSKGVANIRGRVAPMLALGRWLGTGVEWLGECAFVSIADGARTQGPRRDPQVRFHFLRAFR